MLGSPKAGTPLMLAAPSRGIDLLLKLLVWEDAERTTWMAWNSAKYLTARHGLAPERAAPLAAVETLVTPAADP